MAQGTHIQRVQDVGRQQHEQWVEFGLHEMLSKNASAGIDQAQGYSLGVEGEVASTVGCGCDTTCTHKTAFRISEVVLNIFKVPSQKT